MQKLAALEPLTLDETTALFERLMSPDEQSVSDAQIGAYLLATAARTLTAEELAGGAGALRKHMETVPVSNSLSLLDTCGTGGSGFKTFNTSTAVAFVCAAAGQAVAKHGNRAASSSSGSADVLEALGVAFSPSPEEAARSLEETGFCFMFAPQHHPATKRVARVRRELGIRTIFNFLGPLANPAGAAYQLLGVSSEKMLPLMAEALQRLGAKRAMLVRGREGLDELSVSGESLAYEIQGDRLEQYTVSPDAFGLSCHPITEVEVSSPQESAEKMKQVFSGESSPYRDLVLLNAGAALYVCQVASKLDEGVAKAAELIDSGEVLRKLEQVQRFSNADPN